MSGAYCPKYENNKKHIAIITNGIPITLRVASSKIKIPIIPMINSIDDARLLYRLSCKGEPALKLPRQDCPSWLESHIPGGYTTPAEIINVQ